MPLQLTQQPPYYEIVDDPANTGIKTYKALLAQTGTDAPTATILTNTFNTTPTWTRLGVGDYRLTATGEFTDGKTICIPFGANDNVNLPISGATLDTAGYQMNRASDNAVYLGTYLNDFTPQELSTLIGGQKLYVHIEVHP